MNPHPRENFKNIFKEDPNSKLRSPRNRNLENSSSIYKYASQI